MCSKSAELLQRNSLAASQLESVSARVVARFQLSIKLPALGIFLHVKQCRFFWNR